MVIGMGVALLMRLHVARPIRLLVQAGLLLAWAMPVVASLTVWQWLFDTQYGVVNWTAHPVRRSTTRATRGCSTRCRSSSWRP